MTFSLRRLSVPEFHMLAPSLVDLYIDAMGYDRALRSRRIDVWRRETALPGFSAVIAVEPAAPPAQASGWITGLAYGFTGTDKVWWHRQVTQGLRPRGRLNLAADYFELAEIHVDPRRQSRGTGAALLRALLAGRSEARVLLSTPEVAGESNAAFRLYRRHGFTDVLRNFRFDGDRRRFAVLGASLPLAGTGPDAAAGR